VLVQVDAVAHAVEELNFPADPIVAAVASGQGKEIGAITALTGCLDIYGRVGAGFQGVIGSSSSGHRKSSGGAAEERDGAEEGAGDEHGFC